MKRTTSVIAAYLYPARTGMADRLVVLVHDWFVVLHPAVGDTQRPLEQIAALLRRQRAVGLDWRKGGGGIERLAFRAG